MRLPAPVRAKCKQWGWRPQHTVSTRDNSCTLNFSNTIIIGSATSVSTPSPKSVSPPASTSTAASPPPTTVGAPSYCTYVPFSVVSPTNININVYINISSSNSSYNTINISICSNITNNSSLSNNLELSKLLQHHTPLPLSFPTLLATPATQHGPSTATTLSLPSGDPSCDCPVLQAAHICSSADASSPHCTTRADEAQALPIVPDYIYTASLLFLPYTSFILYLAS